MHLYKSNIKRQSTYNGRNLKSDNSYDYRDYVKVRETEYVNRINAPSHSYLYVKEYWSALPPSSSSQKHVRSRMPSAKHFGFSVSTLSNRSTATDRKIKSKTKSYDTHTTDDMNALILETRIIDHCYKHFSFLS